MKIDHVSIGWSDLGILQDLFANSGMATEYGGPHSSGNTHMSLLGFRDGSYIELISTVRPDAVSSSWKLQIENDGGPCAWCVEQKDIAQEVDKAKRSRDICDRSHRLHQEEARRRPRGVGPRLPRGR